MVFRLPRLKICSLPIASVAGPDHFDTDPDPTFHFATDPTFHFDTDPYCFKEVMYLNRYFVYLLT